jgi:hypothetical protein
MSLFTLLPVVIATFVASLPWRRVEKKPFRAWFTMGIAAGAAVGVELGGGAVIVLGFIFAIGGALLPAVLASVFLAAVGIGVVAGFGLGGLASVVARITAQRAPTYANTAGFLTIVLIAGVGPTLAGRTYGPTKGFLAHEPSKIELATVRTLDKPVRGTWRADRGVMTDKGIRFSVAKYETALQAGVKVTLQTSDHRAESVVTKRLVGEEREDYDGVYVREPPEAAAWWKPGQWIDLVAEAEVPAGSLVVDKDAVTFNHVNLVEPVHPDRAEGWTHRRKGADVILGFVIDAPTELTELFEIRGGLDAGATIARWPEITIRGDEGEVRVEQKPASATLVHAVRARAPKPDEKGVASDDGYAERKGITLYEIAGDTAFEVGLPAAISYESLAFSGTIASRETVPHDGVGDPPPPARQRVLVIARVSEKDLRRLPGYERITVRATGKLRPASVVVAKKCINDVAALGPEAFVAVPLPPSDAAKDGATHYVQQRAVTLGLTVGEDIELREGVKEGELVVWEKDIYNSGPTPRRVRIAADPGE